MSYAEPEPVLINHDDLCEWCGVLYDKYCCNQHLSQDTVIHTMIQYFDDHLATHSNLVSVDYLDDGGFFILLALASRGDIGYQKYWQSYGCYGDLIDHLKLDHNLITSIANDIMLRYDKLICQSYPQRKPCSFLHLIGIEKENKLQL